MQCRNCFPSFGVFNLVPRRFGPKKAVVGHKMRTFGRALPNWRPLPRGATGEFLAKNLDLARTSPSL